MKKNTIRLILPVTIIAFAFFTKWWYVYIIDGKDVIMQGFPFIYKSEALHTSMASHYFIIPWLVDFLFYFIFCFTIIYTTSRFWKYRITLTFSVLLWLIALLATAYSELEIVFSVVCKLNKIPQNLIENFYTKIMNLATGKCWF